MYNYAQKWKLRQQISEAVEKDVLNDFLQDMFTIELKDARGQGRGVFQE